MKKRRVMVLMDESLVPPDTLEGVSDRELLEWKSEFDVCATLREIGHEVQKVGVSDDLGVIRRALKEGQPHVAFNLLEEFHGVAVYDQHVAAYLELMRQPYTGCNPRGLMLAHDKALSKKILTYHRIPTPRFAVFPRGHKVRVPKRHVYPLFVKSVVEDASFGLTKKNLVYNEKDLLDRVAHVHDEVNDDALVEEFIEGREMYVGVLGNNRLQTFPVWELVFKSLPSDIPNIATSRVKWDEEYQKKLGVETQHARDLPPGTDERLRKLAKRIYRVLNLSGYARMDFRMKDDGQVFVLEANPNPNLSYGEDFAESASEVGVTYEKLLQRILSLGLSYRPAWHGSM